MEMTKTAPPLANPDDRCRTCGRDVLTHPRFEWSSPACHYCGPDGTDPWDEKHYPDWPPVAVQKFLVAAVLFGIAALVWRLL